MDAASRSLSDALKVSFWVLRLVMIGLVVLFILFSGWEKIDEGHVGVKVRFGAAQGEKADNGAFAITLLRPGAHFTLPEPIERIIKVPTSPRTLRLEEDFTQVGMRVGEWRLTGWLMTGDKNLLQAMWQIKYRVDPEEPGAVQRFIGNVSSSLDKAQMDRDANRVVKLAAERAIIHLVSSSTVDDVRANRFSDEASRRMLAVAQKTLDDMESGIRISEIIIDKPQVPAAVQSTFDAATKAEQDRGARRVAAEQAANKTLIDAAGENHDLLVASIEAYEQARLQADPPAADAAMKRINELLDSDQIKGQAKAVVSQARGMRSTIVKQIQSEAEAFDRLLPLYRGNPGFLKSRLWSDARAMILSGEGVETFYLPQGANLQLEINPDPQVSAKREMKANEEAQKARESSGGGR